MPVLADVDPCAVRVHHPEALGSSRLARHGTSSQVSSPSRAGRNHVRNSLDSRETRAISDRGDKMRTRLTARQCARAGPEPSQTQAPVTPARAGATRRWKLNNKHAPEAFHAVGVGHAPDELPGVVPDRLVVERHPQVGTGLVGIHRGPRGSDVRHKPLKRGLAGIRDHPRVNPPGVSVLRARNRRLARHATSSVPLPHLPPAGSVHVLPDAPDVGLVRRNVEI